MELGAEATLVSLVMISMTGFFSFGREHGPLTADEAKRWLVTASQVSPAASPGKYRVGEVLFKPRFVANK